MALSYKSIAGIDRSEVVARMGLTEGCPTTGCILWTGALDRGGYGDVSICGKKYKVHRVAYEIAKGPIPKGLVLDHLCRVRSCVNPHHLMICTIGENVLKGDTIPARNKIATHCKKGHEFTALNTTHLSRGGRVCRTCANEGHRAIKTKNPELIKFWAAEWRRNNKEKLKALKKKYYEQNKEAILKKDKARRDHKKISVL